MWARLLCCFLFAGCASATPGFQLLGEPENYRGVVAAVQGNAAVEAGQECTVLVAQTSNPTFDCRIRVRCGEDVLYGSAEAGYNRCSGGPDGLSLAEDRLGTRRDGDPKLVLNLELGLVTVSDLRPDMEVVIAIPELRPQIPDSESTASTLQLPERPLSHGTLVRVWANARMRARASARGLSLRTDAFTERERSGRVGADWQFMVLADHGEFVEVTVPTQGCGATALPGFAGLRLFVDRRDLVPVATETVEVEFDDGTQVRLHPGAILLPLGGSRYRTLAAGYPLELELPDTAPGEGFTVDSDETPEEEFIVDAGLPVDLAGETVRQSPHGGTRLAALSVDDAGAEVALVWVRGCHSDARVRIARTGVRQGGALLQSLTGAAGVPNGTQMFWSDGGLAGRVEGPWPVREPPQEEGDRACFQWIVPARSDAPTEPEQRTLRLCTTPAPVNSGDN